MTRVIIPLTTARAWRRRRLVTRLVIGSALLVAAGVSREGSPISNALDVASIAVFLFTIMRLMGARRLVLQADSLRLYDVIRDQLTGSQIVVEVPRQAIIGVSIIEPATDPADPAVTDSGQPPGPESIGSPPVALAKKPHTIGQRLATIIAERMGKSARKFATTLPVENLRIQLSYPAAARLRGRRQPPPHALPTELLVDVADPATAQAQLTAWLAGV